MVAVCLHNGLLRLLMFIFCVTHIASVLPQLAVIANIPVKHNVAQPLQTDSLFMNGSFKPVYFRVS